MVCPQSRCKKKSQVPIVALSTGGGQNTKKATELDECIGPHDVQLGSSDTSMVMIGGGYQWTRRQA